MPYCATSGATAALLRPRAWAKGKCQCILVVRIPFFHADQGQNSGSFEVYSKEF